MPTFLQMAVSSQLRAKLQAFPRMAMLRQLSLLKFGITKMIVSLAARNWRVIRGSRRRQIPSASLQTESCLVVSEPRTLYVLDPSTLKLIHAIEPPLPDDFRIFHVETAPIGHVAIVGANRYVTGMLFAYDIDTGIMLFRWEPPYGVGSIAWKPDGTQFAVATPMLCTRARDAIQIFNASPWSHLRTLKARNPTSVALSEERLFVVESGACKGSIFDRHLGLESFDTQEWRRHQTMFLRGRDIHDWVSYADGRLVADTGEIKTSHDWLDATTTGTSLDMQFTVWAREPLSVEFTSRSWEVPRRLPPAMSSLRLSRTGKMIMLIHDHKPQVFEIP